MQWNDRAQRDVYTGVQAIHPHPTSNFPTLASTHVYIHINTNFIFNAIPFIYMSHAIDRNYI